MNKFYLTFSTCQYDRPHSYGGDKDGWIEVLSTDLDTARDNVIKLIGRNWAFIHTEATFNPNLYQKGCLKVLTFI